MSLFTSILALPQRLIDAVVAIPEAIKANTEQVKRIADRLDIEAAGGELPDSIAQQLIDAKQAIKGNSADLSAAVDQNQP